MAQSQIQFKSSDKENIEIIRMIVWDNTSVTVESKEIEIALESCFKFIEVLEAFGFSTNIWTNTNFEWYFVVHTNFSDIKSFYVLVEILNKLHPIVK